METFEVKGQLKKVWKITAHYIDRDGEREDEWARSETRQGAIDAIIPKLWKYRRQGMKYATFILGQVWVFDIILPEGYHFKENDEWDGDLCSDELATRGVDIVLGRRNSDYYYIIEEQQALIAELESSPVWKEVADREHLKEEKRAAEERQEKEKKERILLEELKNKYEGGV